MKKERESVAFSGSASSRGPEDRVRSRPSSRPTYDRQVSSYPIDRRSLNKNNYTSHSPVTREFFFVCFHCNKPGHTKREYFLRMCEQEKAHDESDIVCDNCGKHGHIRSRCHSLNRDKQGVNHPSRRNQLTALSL